VAFTRVDYQQLRITRRLQHFPARDNRAAHERDVVSQRFTKASRFYKITLHVDHDQCSCFCIEREWEWLCVK
jgi:hypothetical protein